jgi:glycerol kinase
VIETTSLGAACLAGLGAGLWTSLDEVARRSRIERTFRPSMPASRREELYDGWRRAIARTRTTTAKETS